MKYNEFKEILESVQIVDKKFYEKLIKNYGKETINNFFEQYMIDPKVVDDTDKYDRTAYYVEVQSCDFANEEYIDLFDNDKLLNEKVKDSFSIYLLQIGEIPLLTEEEELKICKRIEHLRNLINSKGITQENLFQELKKVGINHTSGNFEEAINALNAKIASKSSIDLERKDLLKLLNNLKIYQTYHDLENKFIETNLRLVINASKRYKSTNVNIEDLVQEGNIGLKRAIDKFEIGKGYKFSTYATWWIRQAMSRSIAETSRTIRIPVHAHEMSNKIKRVSKALEQELGRKPKEEEILNAINGNGVNKLSLQHLRYYSQIGVHPVSLSTPVGEGEVKESTLGDFVPADQESIEDTVMVNLYEDYIKTILPYLQPRERLVIILRIGLRLEEYMSFNDFVLAINSQRFYTEIELNKLYRELCDNPRNYTLQETGDIFKITRERIRQIEAKSYRKLRNKTIKDRSILY